MDPSDKITAQINTMADWRGALLKDLHRLINEAGPELTEDFKWGVPVWTHKGLVCAISAFKDHVKINFFKGAYLPNPKKLFNSGLDSKEYRSINFAKGGKLDKIAIAELIHSSVAHDKK